MEPTRAGNTQTIKINQDVLGAGLSAGQSSNSRFNTRIHDNAIGLDKCFRARDDGHNAFTSAPSSDSRDLLMSEDAPLGVTGRRLITCGLAAPTSTPVPQSTSCGFAVADHCHRLPLGPMYRARIDSYTPPTSLRLISVHAVNHFLTLQYCTDRWRFDMNRPRVYLPVELTPAARLV